MKDPKDLHTLPLIPESKKRGRPSTGNALSPAERKRNQRLRSLVFVNSRDLELAVDAMGVTSLLDGMSYCISHGLTDNARIVADELVLRASIREGTLLACGGLGKT